MVTFTITEKRKAAERESALRKRVYPRWVESGKMMQGQAHLQIALMDAIAADYAQLEAQAALPLSSS